MQEFEAAVSERKQDFRSGGGKVTERVRVSPDTLKFKDVDESRWEKGTQASLKGLIPSHRSLTTFVKQKRINEKSR